MTAGMFDRLRISRFEVRWIKRHPFRWLRLMWLHFTVAFALAAMAWTVGEPVFVVTTAARAWPILLGIAAGITATSALAPLDERLQAFAASTLFSIFALRAATFVDTLVRAPDLSPGARAIAVAFSLHWALLALIAVWWPTISERAGRELAVEAGADERGRMG